MSLPAISTILYIVIGVIFLFSILKGLIQGAKKNIYFFFSTIVFWVIFFITAKLLSPAIKALAESSEVYSLISSLTGDTTSKNLIEYATTLLGSISSEIPSGILQDESILAVIISIVHLVLKLVYLFILWIVYGILSLIVYRIFFRKYSVTSARLLRKYQIRERDNYAHNRPYNRSLGRKLRRISRNIKHNGANKGFGLLTGFIRGALACFLILSLINALVFTLPDFSKIDLTNPESSQEEENYELYSYISTLENGAYKDIVDYIIAYQKDKLSKVTAIEINGKPADKMFLDAILSGESANFNIALRDEIEQFVKLAVLAQNLTNNFNFESIDFLHLTAAQIETLKTMITTIANDSLIKNLLPIAVSFALSLDAVKQYIPEGFDTTVLDEFDWSQELVNIANLVVSVYELGGDTGLDKLDYLNLDGTKVKAICTNLGNLQCLQIALDLGGSYAVDNLLTDFTDAQKTSIKDNLAKICLKDDLEDIGDIYTEFLNIKVSEKLETSKDTEGNVNYIKALTSVDSDDYNSIINTLFETSFMVNLLPDVLDIVKTKYLPAEYADMINPSITASADWKNELNTVFDIVGELTRDGRDPIETIETIPLTRLTNISTNTIINSKLLSYATITILVQSSKGEGIGSALQEYIKVPDNLTILNETTHTYPDAWYPSTSTAHDGELYVMFNTIKNAASQIDDINSITNSIVPMITSIDATEISSSTVLQYSISNLLFQYGKDYIVVPYSCFTTETCANASLNVINTQELENIITAITDENVLNYDAAFKYTYKNDNEEDVVVYKEEDVPEGKDAIKELNLTDTQSIINVVLSTKLYNPDNASDDNLNTLFASKILRATITDLVESLAGEFIKLPGASLEPSGEKALDKEGVEKNIDIVTTKELNNLVKVFMKLDIDITTISSNPLSILDNFGTTEGGVKTFNEDFTSSIFDNSKSNTDYSSIIHFTFSDLLINSSDLLGDSFTIAIPNESKTNDGYIKKDEIVKLFKSVYYLDINALKESTDTNSIISTILDNDHRSELFSSDILRATITNLLSGDDLGITLPTSNEGINEEADYIYSQFDITYSATSQINNKVITEVEINKILTAISSLKTEITGEDPEVSFDISTVFTSIKIGNINNIKDDLLDSKIISATVSKLIIDMADPSASFELVIEDTVCNGTYITSDELTKLFNTLTLIVGSDTSIDNVGDINIDTILDIDAQDLLQSKIITDSIANVLAGLTMIDIPSALDDSDLYTEITKYNETTKTNIISSTEITNIIEGIQKFKKVVQGSSTEPLALEDLFNFETLTLSKINEATDDLLKSKIIRYTITKKVTELNSESLEIVIENTAYEKPYIKTKDLKDLFNSLTLIVGDKTIDEIGDINIDKVLEVDKDELFKSIILKDSIAKLISTLDMIDIPSALDDSDLYQTITKYNNESIDIICGSEIDAIFAGINSFMNKVKENPEDTISLENLFNFDTLKLSKINEATADLVNSKIINYTITNKINEMSSGTGFDLIIRKSLITKVYISNTELVNLFNSLTLIVGDKTINELGNIDIDSVLNVNRTTLFASQIVKDSVASLITGLDAIDIPESSQDSDLYQTVTKNDNSNVSIIKDTEVDAIFNAIDSLKQAVQGGSSEPITLENLFNFDTLKLSKINEATEDLVESYIIRYTITNKITDMTSGTDFDLIIESQVYEKIYITKQELIDLFNSLTLLAGDKPISEIGNVDIDTILKEDRTKLFKSLILKDSICKLISTLEMIEIPGKDKDDTLYQEITSYTSTKLDIITYDELTAIFDAIDSLMASCKTNPEDEISLENLFDFSKLTIGKINNITTELFASKIITYTISKQIISMSGTGSLSLKILSSDYDNVYLDDEELVRLFNGLTILAGDNTSINSISGIDTNDVLDNEDIRDTFTSHILQATISNIIATIDGLIVPINDENVVSTPKDINNADITVITTTELSSIIDVYDALTEGTSTKGLAALEFNNLTVTKISSVSDTLVASKVINATITDKLKTNSAIQIGIDSNYTSINDNTRKIISDTNKYYITDSDLEAFFTSIATIAGDNTLSNIQVNTSTILAMTSSELDTLFSSEILVNTVSTKIYAAFGTNLEFLNYSAGNDHGSHGYTETTITKAEEVNLFLALQVVKGSASDISNITFNFDTLTNLSNAELATLCNSNLISYNVYKKIKDQNDSSSGFNGLLKLDAYGNSRVWYMDTQTATDDDLYNLLISITILYGDPTSKSALTTGISSTSDLANLISDSSVFIPTMTNNKILCDSLPNIVNKFSSAIPATMVSGSFYEIDKLKDTQFTQDSNLENTWKTFWQTNNQVIKGSNNTPVDSGSDYINGELYRLINGIIEANSAISDLANFSEHYGNAQKSIILKNTLSYSPF